ncbi:MAG: deoxyribodipyrimidine photo-lyase, partial [Chlamydiia bacterium]|nr:deoxyribodipyrimidine photo-lyase [Chlamydiia bacterium]
MSTLVWIRNDLRLLDNPALYEAARLGAVLPVFIWDPDQKRVPGSASRAWLHHSLKKLEVSMGGLILRRGDSQKELMKLIEQTGVEQVFWNRRYTPQGILTDTKIKKALKEAGKEVQSFPGNLLFEPWTVANKQGKPYQVFTPFWKGCLAGEPPEKPLPKPKRLTYVEGVSSLKLKDLDLLPKIYWDKGFWDVWEPGEEAALKKLRRFAEGPVEDYEEERNFPAHEGTSRLSPHLHFGEISARTIWSEIKEARCF